MVSLPQFSPDSDNGGGERCKKADGKACGAGLEKIYPTSAVRYGAMNWIGEFSYRPGTAFKCGAKVVIQTDRGMEIGEQVSLFCNGCNHSVTRERVLDYVKTSGPEFYKLRNGRIMREASTQDVDEHARLNSHLGEDIDRAALLAAQLQLDIKIVTVEHLLGGERIVFYFRSEERVDFRQLVRELASHYRTRIEMRQVGARDEARLVADYEICGRECCCKNFLKKLRPVSMKMAKVQKSTLDPTKVSGRCGRLRCCLRYEHEGYEALLKKLPRTGSRIATEFGEATVVDRQTLTQLVLVRLDDGREMTIPVEELGENAPRRPAPAPPEAPPRKDQNGARKPDAKDGPGSRRGGRDHKSRGDGAERADRRPSRSRRRSNRPRRGAGESAPEPGRESPASNDAKPPKNDQEGTPDRPAKRRRRRRRGRSGPQNPPTNGNSPDKMN